MKRSTLRERLSSAKREIRYLDGLIEYHDAEASRLRKEREKYKAKRDRAEAAIDREAAARIE